MKSMLTTRVRIAFALLMLSIGLASAASATTNTFQILMDLDNNQATGCNASTLGAGFPSFPGVEQVLITTVTTSGSTAQVTAVQVQTCAAGAFGAAVPVPAPAGHPLPWAVGTLNGTGNPSFIETYFPLSLSTVANPLNVRLAVFALNNSGALTDSLLATAGGGPVILQVASVAEIPTLSDWGLYLLGIVLALSAVALLRRRRTAGTVLLALLLLSAAGVAWAVTGSTDLNGTTTSEWNGSNLLATAGPSTPPPDIEAVYGFKDPTLNALAFRVDSQLVFTTPQTITFTSTPPANAMVGGATYNVTATASSGLPVTVSIDASATAVCSLSGSTVSFLSVGTCVIDANQAGDANFDPAPQVQQSIPVGKGNQTITFTSTAPAGAMVNGSTYNVTATASSGLPVSFSIDASATSVCSLSGSTVSFIGSGTCVIDANQAGDANWNAAPQAQQSFAVGTGDQTITFTSTPPANAKVGGPTYNVTATATSGLPVSFTIDASATTVCSIAGSTVSFIGAGTCVIDANQAGDANWNAAPQVQQSFAVAKGDQTITFTSTPPASAAVNGPTYTVTATASSGLPVTFTIDAAATSVCSISGSTVSFLAVGTCVIDANQAGDANWNAAPQAQQSFSVGKGSQTITFTSTPPASPKVGGPTYTVTATASSGLPVTFTIDASATTVCSISGSTVSFLAAGTCVIDANQAGDANWNAAPQAQQSFPVGKGDQTITFTSTPPVNAKVGGPTYTVTATASSGLPVTFTIDASATTVCSISGSTVSFLTVGTCVIDANQAGNPNFNAAPQAQQSFAVAKGDQTISFTSTPPVNAKVGGPTYTVTATASPSGLPVTFTIDASATSVCSITGSTVSFLAVGTCVIDANQAGNANYNAAPQAQQSFAVAKGDQTISFTSTAPVNAKVGGPTYTVTATATSGLPVTFTIDASATSVCSITGSTVSFLAVGTCVIDANQAGSANYNAAPQAQQSFAVAKGDQTISFTSTAPVNAKVGGPTYTVTATATSGLPVTFTIDGSATSVCSITGSTVSFLTAGTCVIDANQAGNTNYNAAPQAQQSFAVAKGDQTISFTSTAPAGATVGGPTYTVTATATSGLPVTFTIDPVATSVCTIAGSTVSFLTAGTCVIDANQAGNANYNPAPQAQQSFAVGKGNQTISFNSTPPAQPVVGGTYTVTATATSGLPVAFTSATPTVCTISGSTVSFVGTGTCTINANQPGNANYNAAPQVQQSFTVNQAPQITSANATSFTSTVPGTFTVTTTGFPTGASMVITESGALPSGVTFVNNNNGTATLAGTPAAGTQGVYVITITANNGIAPNATQSFTLTVLNNPPQLTTNPITYTTPGNTQLQVAGATLPGVASWSDPQSINAKAQPTDADGPGALSIVAASGTTANGGTYSIAVNGSFTYVPAAGFTGADSFTYQVTDTQSATTGTVNITVGQRVWYIRDVIDANNAAGGDGRSTNAFDSITAFNAATTNNGDIIYIFEGNTGTTPLSGSITLKDGQKLWGQGIALNVPGFGTPLVAATNKAHIRSTVASTPAVSVPATAGNRNSVEVRGLDISTTGATSNAVDVTSSGANTVDVTISDNNVSGATAKGVNLAEGGTGAFTAALNNNALAATGNAFDARTTAGAGTLTISFTNNAAVSNATGISIDGSLGGTTWITGFANNAVSQNNVGTGIAITSARFDATPGGSYQTVSGGATVVGASGNGVGTSGVVLTNVSGDLAFTDLDIFADAGAALRITGTGAVNTGAGTGTRVTVGAGVATFTAVGGPAVDITGATIDLQLGSLTSTNSATTGVALNSTTGTFSAAAGGISGSTGTAFQVGSSNATISYVPAINSTTGKGVDLTSNTGSTISFTGTLTLSSGSNTAFNATGGGTVSTTDTNSTLTTTTGVALNVANTTIGSGGLHFKSISSNGAANGILLNNTGTTAGLTVHGVSGTNNSGGTIQNSTGDGISLTSTRNVSLTEMRVANSAQSHIDATTVTNLTLNSMEMDTSNDHGIKGSGITNLTISGGTFNRGGAGAEPTCNFNGVEITNLLGTSTVTSATFTRSNTIQFHVVNSATSGSQDKLTISGTTWGTHTGPCAGDHLSVASDTGGNLKLVTDASSGKNAFTTGGIGVQAAAQGSGSMEASLTGIQTSGNTAGVAIAATATSNIGFNVFNNNTANGTGFSGTGSVALIMTCTTSGTCQGAFNNNSITHTAGTATNAMQVVVEGNGTGRVNVANNVVNGNFQRGLLGQSRSGTGSLSLNVATNNFTATDAGGLQVMDFEVGASGGGTTNSLCLNLAGNTATPAGAMSAYRLVHRAGYTYQLQNLAQASTTTVSDVQTWVTSTKSNAGTPVSVTVGASPFTTSAGCSTPTLPTP